MAMQFTGGSRCGINYWISWNASWPLANLKIEPDELVLSTFLFSTYRFKKSQISKLSKCRRFFFSSGIRIEHTIGEYSPFIVFWTFCPEKVKMALIENGYNVI
jgi:hypothetical protein